MQSQWAKGARPGGVSRTTRKRGKKKTEKKDELSKRAKALPAVDVGCETCTVDSCGRRAEGSRCTKWEHLEEKESREWTIITQGRELTEEEKQRHREEWLKHNDRTMKYWGGYM